MMSIMRKLRGFGNKDTFCKAPIRETTEELHNPARGWYQIHYFQLEKEVDFEELKWCLGKDDMLVLLIINIGSFKEKNLDETALQRMRDILDFFALHKYDIILRVTYDHEGKAMEREPFFFSQVEAHMKQIVPIVDEFDKKIFIYQGLLVGNWGEMHTTRFLSEEKMTRLSNILRSRKHNTAFLAVRKPVQWRILHINLEKEGLPAQDDIGLFDDGILGDEFHLGTFSEETKGEVGWNHSWLPSEELEFEEELCQFVPNGGEVLFNPSYIETLGKEKIIELLRQMHITYLNRVHDSRMIYYWKQSVVTEPGLWNQKSYYDYIGAHLGYRFVIRNMEVSSKTKEEVTVEITIENTGFAAFYQEGELILEMENHLGEISWISIGQIKGWKSGETRTYSGQIKKEKGKLFLWANRCGDNRLIRFANETDQNGRVLLGTFVG